MSLQSFMMKLSVNVVVLNVMIVLHNFLDVTAEDFVEKEYVTPRLIVAVAVYLIVIVGCVHVVVFLVL